VTPWRARSTTSKAPAGAFFMVGDDAAHTVAGAPDRARRRV